MKLKLCGYPGCNKLTQRYYCDKHQAISDKKKAEHDNRARLASATRSSLYQSPEWRILSRSLIVEKGRCERCGCTEHLQAHHIIPVRYAPELSLDRANLIVLCRECHTNETKREMYERRKR